MKSFQPLRKSNIPQHGFKTFIEAIKASHFSTMKGKKFLQDKRLTHLEKKLISCFLLMRENDFSFIQNLITDTSFESDSFLNGMRHLFLGSALVYKADAYTAEHHLEQAIALMKEEADEPFIQRMIFKSHANLFFAYVNQKKLKEMDYQFQKTKVFLSDNEEDKISFMLMEVCSKSMQGDYSQSEIILEKLQTLKNEMTDIQKMSYFIEKFDYYIKQDSLLKSQEVLKEMKTQRTFRLSACYQYMDRLLKFVMNDEQIYAYDREFVGHDDLFLMINVIQNLVEANWDEANFSWAKLASKAPDTYLPEFNYKGDKCLFSVALQKCLEKKDLSPLILQKKYTEIELTLITTLMESTGSQLKKETLFEAIYKKEMTSKDDLIALSSIVYRINKKEELMIKSKKGSYFIA